MIGDWEMRPYSYCREHFVLYCIVSFLCIVKLLYCVLYCE